MNMDAEIFEQYWESIPIIENQNILANIVSADFPYMKEADRGKTYKKVQKLAYPKGFQNNKEQKAVSTEQFAIHLARQASGR